MSTDYESLPFAARKGRTRPPFKTIPHKTQRKRFRGTPAPPKFDLDELAPSQVLTERETASVTRRSQSTLESWRRYQPDHPLKWRRIDGRIMYEVRHIRQFLKGDAER